MSRYSSIPLATRRAVEREVASGGETRTAIARRHGVKVTTAQSWATQVPDPQAANRAQFAAALMREAGLEPTLHNIKFAVELVGVIAEGLPEALADRSEYAAAQRERRAASMKANRKNREAADEDA